MREEGVAQGGSKCNIEFKIGACGGSKMWTAVVGTPKKLCPPTAGVSLKIEWHLGGPIYRFFLHSLSL